MINFFVGIDISRDHFNVAVINTDGELIKSFKLSQNISHFQKLKDYLSNLSSPQNLAIALESSSNYHINLLSFLLANDFSVFLINPILIHNFHKSSSLRKTKTDKIDARIIANFLRKHRDSIHKFSPDDSVKLLSREREAIAREIARIKTQIKQIIFNIFKEILDSYNILSRSWLNFLLHIPSARVARQMSLQEIQCIVDKINSGRGRKSNINPSEILKIANNTISIDDPNREIILKSKIRRLLQLEEELEILTSELISRMQFFRPGEMKILASIPGVGEVSAASFLAEVQDIEKFKGSYKKFIAFAGLDPVIYESGNYRRRMRISKRGSPHIRRIIWNMTIGTIFYTNLFREYYSKKRGEGKSHKRAVISTSNKFMRILFHLLTSGGLFHDSQPQIIHS